MRLLIGFLLALVGGVIVVVGLLGALGELFALYSSALNDAMADGPEAKAVGANMMRWVILGVAGVPLLIVGVVILKISLIQKLLKMSKARDVRAQRPVAASKWDVPAKPAGERSTERPQAVPPRPNAVREMGERGEGGGSKRER